MTRFLNRCVTWWKHGDQYFIARTNFGGKGIIQKQQGYDYQKFLAKLKQFGVTDLPGPEEASGSRLAVVAFKAPSAGKVQ